MVLRQIAIVGGVSATANIFSPNAVLISDQKKKTALYIFFSLARVTIQVDKKSKIARLINPYRREDFPRFYYLPVKKRRASDPKSCYSFTLHRAL